MITFLNKYPKIIISCLAAFVIFAFAAGLFAGRALYMTPVKSQMPFTGEKHKGQYEFINPLLECEGSEELISGELRSFKDKIINIINEDIKNQKALSVAVYFRDLNDGPWFGINEREPFYPGSLLKVPIMMGILKKAESDPGIMARRIKYDKKISSEVQVIKPSIAIELGKSYTIEELVYRMIVYSDNEAAYLLLSFNNGSIVSDIEKMFYELGILPPSNNLGEYNVNVRQYTTFFRILFNASYLSKESSNMALKLLGKVEFDEGLSAGAPSNIPVAHKFGELTINGQKQFHDCGIVYYPKSPYLLCTMSRGEEYKDLISVTRDISAAVFKEVDRQKQASKK